MRAGEMKHCDIFAQAGGLVPQPITCIAHAGGEAYVLRNEHIFISARGLAAWFVLPQRGCPSGEVIWEK